MSKPQTQHKYSFGIAVMRCQPFHLGHDRLIKTMIEDCQDCMVVLGTSQEWGTKKNPLTLEERKQLILNIYPKLKIIGVPDLGQPELWAEYVFRLIEDYFIQNNLPILQPEAYYAGSQYDAKWFEGQIDHIINLNRNAPQFPFISGSMLRDMLTFKDNRWKQFVHPKNHKLIKEKLYGKTFN